jgi:hypothetical protein
MDHNLFIASGDLYVAGDKIGTTDYIIAEDYLPSLASNHRGPIHVVDRLDSDIRLRDANIIGMATIEYVPEEGDRKARLRATIDFNETNSDIYEKIITNPETRNMLRLGFFMTRIDLSLSKDKIIRNGRFSAIALSETCTGGVIDNFLCTLRPDDIDVLRESDFR